MATSASIGIFLEAGLSPERAERLAERLKALDPLGAVPVKNRFHEDPETGKILLTPEYLAYYRKRFAEAGLNLDNYRSNRKDFIKGLRAVNAHAWAKLEAETDRRLAQTKDQAMIESLAAFRNKDFAEARRLLEVSQRRKAFKIA
ncbi:hypothetical protein [Thiomonas sp.]